MKILIVEDDFVSRTVLQEILSPYGICHAASDGLEAISAYEHGISTNTPYDLICLDIMMPNLDGQEVVKQIRAREKAQGIGGPDQTKIIMITALSDAKNIMSALVKGSCEAYLVKPVNADKLLAEMQRIGLAFCPVKNRPGEMAPVLRTGTQPHSGK